MDYDKIIEECEARAEMYKRTGAVWNATHEEQCKTTIAELIERAEQAEKGRDEYKELFFSYKHVCGGVDPQRIGELVEADKNGRCVVLPCKIGDTCYWIVDKGIYECYFDLSASNYIGKSVFLTREAAEAALKGERNE